MKVILPGSYDPVTVGHLEMIKRAAAEFDEVYAVAFNNSNKSYRFSPSERLRMLELSTEDMANVKVDYYDGLVIDYMGDHGIDKIVKGYRTEADLPWEKEQAEWNLERGYGTVLWKCDTEMEDISSTAVRAALEMGDEEVAASMLHPKVADFIKEKGRK